MGSAQAQLIEVGGAGTIGVTPLTTAQVPATTGRWAVAGTESVDSCLYKPVTTMAAGNVTLTFDHTYQFEFGHDFGSVVCLGPEGFATVTSVTNGFDTDSVIPPRPSTPGLDADQYLVGA